MAYCKKCGKQIEDDSVFCPYCGTTQGNQQANYNQQSNYSQQPNYYNQQPNYNPQMNGGYYAQQPVPPYNQAQPALTWDQVKQAGYIIGKNGKQYKIGGIKFTVNVFIFFLIATHIFGLFVSFLARRGIIDLISLCMNIFFVVYLLIARSKMVNLKKSGVIMYFIYFVLGIIVGIINVAIGNFDGIKATIFNVIILVSEIIVFKPRMSIYR